MAILQCRRVRTTDHAEADSNARLLMNLARNAPDAQRREVLQSVIADRSVYDITRKDARRDLSMMTRPNRY